VNVIAPVLTPAILSGISLAVAWRLWRRKNPSPRGHWGGAVAFGLAYFSGHVALVGWPEFPPTSAETWQAWLALSLAVAGVAQRWWGPTMFVSFPVAFLAYAAVTYALLLNFIRNSWDPTVSALWVAGLAAASTIVFQLTDRIAAKRPGASVPLGLWALCTLAAGTFVVASSAKLGQLSGALAAGCGAAVVLAWWCSKLSLAGGGVFVFLPLYNGLVLQAYFFGYPGLGLWSALLLALAPLGLLVGEQRRFVYAKPWIAVLVRTGAVAVPAAIALGLAIVSGGDAPSDTYYDY